MKIFIAAFTILTLLLGACTNSIKSHEQTATQAASDSSLTASSDNTVSTTEVVQKSNPFVDIQVGMKDEKVRALLGKPAKVDVLNSELGERVEDWWYGDNQKIRMTGGQVTRIVKDVAKEQETLQKIKEAKEKGDETEAQRLLDEIDSNN